MVTLTKAQRSAAAKKAAATRKRNQTKGAGEELRRELQDLKRAGEHVGEAATGLVKTAGSAVKKTAEATTDRAMTEVRRRSHR